MKPLMLMLTFTFIVLVHVATITETTDMKKKSFSIENLDETNLTKHTSRIQRRSILQFLGLKPRYRPIQITVNWRKPNQQRLIKNNYNNSNHWNTQRINTRPNSLHIQKNIFIYNGYTQNKNNQNPAVRPSTTPRSSTTTTPSYIVKTEPTTRMEEILSVSSTQQTESTFTSRFPTSTEVTQLGRDQSTQNVGNIKTTQIYQTTTSTTSKPRTERPVIINPVPTTESTLSKTTNDLNAIERAKGGFTSTSMPQKDQYSELIYDIDPRYRIR